MGIYVCREKGTILLQTLGGQSKHIKGGDLPWGDATRARRDPGKAGVTRARQARLGRQNQGRTSSGRQNPGQNSALGQNSTRAKSMIWTWTWTWTWTRTRTRTRAWACGLVGFFMPSAAEPAPLDAAICPHALALRGVVRSAMLDLAEAGACEWYRGCLCLLAPCLGPER